jgi:crotonobetainyl-CoA:carnitine CoA-transferase CaiB-like acyl-CoA transferase
VGNRLENSAPLDNWRTKDGRYVCIIAAGSGFFPSLVRAMGRPELAEDERFRTLTLRAQHAEEINGIVADWCSRHTAGEIEEILVAAEVPFSLIFNVKEIVDDPHVRAREDIVTVDDPVIGAVKMQGVYPRMSRTPGTVRCGAPRLGEHNDEVYRQLLGLSDEEMSALRAEGVI